MIAKMLRKDVGFSTLEVFTKMLLEGENKIWEGKVREMRQQFCQQVAMEYNLEKLSSICSCHLLSAG